MGTPIDCKHSNLIGAQSYTVYLYIMSSAIFLATILLLAGSIICEGGPNQGLLDALHVKVLGEGKKTLVLSHGYATDQSVWHKILPFLEKNYKVILFDLPFAGAVNPSKFNYNRYKSYEGYADDLLLILDELNVDKCVFLGHSMSAMIGSIASIRKPSLFEKLIYLGGSPRYLNAPGYQGGFEQTAIDQLLQFMKTNYTGFASTFPPMAVGARFTASIEEFKKTILSMNHKVAIFVAKQVFECDERLLLPHVRVPVVIIQSRKDIIAPLFVAQYLKTHLGGKTSVKLLPTEGHLPQLSAPHLLIKALKHFL